MILTSTITQGTIFTYGAIILLAVCLAYMTSKYSAARWSGNEGKIQIVSIGIMLAVTIAALFVFKASMHTIKVMSLCAIYLVASYGDIKTHEADDSIHVAIVLASLIESRTNDLPGMVVAAFLVGGMLLFVSLLSGGSGVGGADVKMAAASAFFLGFWRACAGVIVGTLLAVIVNGIKQKKTGKKETFALLPYLSVGFMPTVFLFV